MSVSSSVFSLWVLLPLCTGTFPQSSSEFGRRMQRDVFCTDDQYLYDSKCCINCPAGMHVTSHCRTSGAKGQCKECDYGTYTEHPNGLSLCLKCKHCRPDQEIVRMCTSTEDAECQCKAGKFCDPHQACEECKTCSKCGEGEEIERNCTSTSNTECKKIQPNPGSGSANKDMIIVYVILGLVVAGALAGVIWYKRCRSEETQSDQPEGLKVVQVDCPFQPSADEWRSTRRLSNSKLDKDFPQLTPLNGESLQKCFEYFEEHVEYNQHKRFFRHLEISDNVIQGKEHLLYEDKIHHLLNIWVEREGREADLNQLLEALLHLDQRRTAEVIMEKAISNGHYEVVRTPQV